MHYYNKKRIHVHLTDGTDHELVIDEITVADGIAFFSREQYELMAAPLTSIIYWNR